uniref:Cytochrome c oxidase subunit 2 n=1 Tax=Vorticeros sp. n. MW-2019 TaxID=2544881 RepID=A0AA49X814_9PLAT|nr:cytochrome c oxidase subunit II [Vorticeros sp. n. MW-2019]
MIIMFVSILVGGLLYQVYGNSYSSVVFIEHSFLEFYWTVGPSIILIFLALPSLKLLYYLDLSNNINTNTTIKSVGHQWYWSNTFFWKGECIESDMYMVNTPDLNLGDLRGLETDSVIVIPVGEVVRLIVTSDDVIHSFAVPTLGVKIDAVPGRINQQYLYSGLVGVFYGQCSEICGANHSFMPITVEVYNNVNNLWH